MRTKIYVAITLVLLGVLQVMGQYIEPKSLVEDKNVGNVEFRMDLNGNQCALLKIISPGNEILKVEGNVVGDLRPEKDVSNVFLTEGTKFIKIYPQTGNALIVNFKDIDKNIDIQGGKSYSLYIETNNDRKDYFDGDVKSEDRDYLLLEDKLTRDEIEKLAAKGDPEACATLASRMLRDEKNPDYKKMYDLYKKAADKGSARGLNGLGLMYDYGYNVKEDKDLAFKYYKQSADKGFPGAYQNLGVCYEFGNGVPKDIEKALYYYELAGKRGIKMVYGNLALCYYFNVENPDPEKFKEYVAKGLGNEDELAYIAAGMAYNDGLLVPQDFNQAFSYFQKAHELGDDTGTLYLGLYNDLGIGTVKNPSKAFMYYKMSAEKGNPRAQFQLGQCYQYGYGTIESIDKAIEWYQKAADQEWEEAIEALKSIKN